MKTIDRSPTWSLNTIGIPDGPDVEVPYIGVTPTFTTELSPKHLSHHVPFSFRGPYVLDRYPGILGEWEGDTQRAACASLTKGGRQCHANAMNRSGVCAKHGGALHPHDKKVIDWENAPREVRWRYGRLPLEELDDEELAKGKIRDQFGRWIHGYTVPAATHREMLAELYKRSDDMLRSNLNKTVGVFVEIATNDAFEPADRLRAAEFIFTRVRGKLPDTVVLTQDKPFEQVLTHMLTGGSRADSRQQRGLEPGEEDILDVEGVDDEAITVSTRVDAVEDDEDEVPEYDDDELTSERADTLPAPPKRTGPAGAPQYGPPRSLVERQRYEGEKKDNTEEAEERRKELAEKRKEHKAKMRSARAAREWTKNSGYKSLAVGVPFEEIQEDDGVRIKFNAD